MALSHLSTWQILALAALAALATITLLVFLVFLSGFRRGFRATQRWLVEQRRRGARLETTDQAR